MTALLNWIDKGAPHAFREAVLGNFEADDGVRFTIVCEPTNWLRGEWKLLVEVEDYNHTWPRFDDMDQPVRYYHSIVRAFEEAQAIADQMNQYHEKKLAGIAKAGGE